VASVLRFVQLSCVFSAFNFILLVEMRANTADNLTLKSQWLLYVPPKYNIKKNYAYCLQSACVRFARIAWQTATVALYGMNLLGFITKIKSVYCAVRTGYLNTLQVILVFKALWDIEFQLQLRTAGCIILLELMCSLLRSCVCRTYIGRVAKYLFLLCNIVV
jgi:hypothetical protein